MLWSKDSRLLHESSSTLLWSSTLVFEENVLIEHGVGVIIRKSIISAGI